METVTDVCVQGPLISWSHELLVHRMSQTFS